MEDLYRLLTWWLNMSWTVLLLCKAKKCKISNILEGEAEGKNKPKLKVDRRLALHAATSEKRWNRCFGLSFNRYNAQSQPILSLEYSMSRTCKRSIGFKKGDTAYCIVFLLSRVWLNMFVIFRHLELLSTIIHVQYVHCITLNYMYSIMPNKSQDN